MTLQCHWFDLFRIFSGSKDSLGTCCQPREVMEVQVSWESKSVNQTWCNFLNRFEIRRCFPSIINEFSQSACGSDHGFYQRNIHGEICYHFRIAVVSLCLGHWKGIVYLWLSGTPYKYLLRVLWKHMMVKCCQMLKSNQNEILQCLVSPLSHIYIKHMTVENLCLLFFWAFLDYLQLS